eukprot:8820907-Heterocapsa_arctica.AAC.1
MPAGPPYARRDAVVRIIGSRTGGGSGYLRLARTAPKRRSIACGDSRRSGTLSQLEYTYLASFAEASAKVSAHVR